MKQIGDILAHVAERDHVTVDIGQDAPGTLAGMDLQSYIGQLETRMKDAAGNLEFEEAARLRDEIRRLEASELGVRTAPTARPAMRAEHQRMQGAEQPRAGAAHGQGEGASAPQRTLSWRRVGSGRRRVEGACCRGSRFALYRALRAV